MGGWRKHSLQLAGGPIGCVFFCVGLGQKPGKK